MVPNIVQRVVEHPKINSLMLLFLMPQCSSREDLKTGEGPAVLEIICRFLKLFIRYRQSDLFSKVYLRQEKFHPSD